MPAAIRYHSALGALGITGGWHAAALIWIPPGTAGLRRGAPATIHQLAATVRNLAALYAELSAGCGLTRPHATDIVTPCATGLAGFAIPTVYDCATAIRRDAAVHGVAGERFAFARIRRAERCTLPRVITATAIEHASAAIGHRSAFCV